MRTPLCIAVLASLVAWPLQAPAVEEAPAGVSVGDKAPVFEALDDAGNPWRSSEHVGRRALVVFFFPAALTGG